MRCSKQALKTCLYSGVIFGSHFQQCASLADSIYGDAILRTMENAQTVLI